MFLARIIGIAAEIDSALFLIDRQQVFHHPGTTAERPDQAAVDSAQLQVLVAAEFAAPHKTLAIVQHLQIVVQIDPGLAHFGVNDGAGAGRGLGPHQIQRALIATLALQQQ